MLIKLLQRVMSLDISHLYYENYRYISSKRVKPQFTVIADILAHVTMLVSICNGKSFLIKEICNFMIGSQTVANTATYTYVRMFLMYNNEYSEYSYRYFRLSMYP